jgi:hypothetical protein
MLLKFEAKKVSVNLDSVQYPMVFRDMGSLSFPRAGLQMLPEGD